MVDFKEYDKTVKRARAIAVAKNSDYGDEPLLMFRERGIVIRMYDKILRAKALTEREAAVKSESLRDTAIDLINYAVYLAMMAKKR